MISVFDRVKNIVEKGENIGYQHFLFFPQCFQKAFFLGLLLQYFLPVQEQIPLFEKHYVISLQFPSVLMGVEFFCWIKCYIQQKLIVCIKHTYIRDHIIIL